MKIFDISLIYHISVIFDMISAIDNRLREKSIKKSVISTIYRRNIGYVAHTRFALIFR